MRAHLRGKRDTAKLHKKYVQGIFHRRLAHNNYANQAAEIDVGPGEFECEVADNNKRRSKHAPPIGSVWPHFPIRKFADSRVCRFGRIAARPNTCEEAFQTYFRTLLLFSCSQLTRT